MEYKVLKYLRPMIILLESNVDEKIEAVKIGRWYMTKGCHLFIAEEDLEWWKAYLKEHHKMEESR